MRSMNIIKIYLATLISMFTRLEWPCPKQSSHYYLVTEADVLLRKNNTYAKNMFSGSNTINTGEVLLSNHFITKLTFEAAGHQEHLLKNTMTSVSKMLVFTILILCTLYHSVTARDCRPYCRVVCDRYPCGLECGVTCSFGKRSVSDKPQNTVTVPFPDKFEKYDLDESGGITLEELAKAINVEEHSKETVKAFQLADKDGDGQIDCSEFKAAPYLFAHQPSC